MYDINDLETSRLLYDIKKQDELERLRKDVPEFSVKIETDGKTLNLDKVARYIVLMYDKESSVRKDYSSIRERKRMAALYAGFSLNPKKKFREEVEQMTVGKYPEVNVMIVKFINQFNDPDFLALCLYLEMYDKQSAGMLQSIADPKEYKTIFEMTEKLRTGIRELTLNILGGQDDEALIRELYRNMESVRDQLMPEFVVDKIASGEIKTYSPYGSRYEQEPLVLMKEKEQIFKG